MGENPRETLVRRMVAEGTSDDDIRATLAVFDKTQAPPSLPRRTEGGRVLPSTEEAAQFGQQVLPGRGAPNSSGVKPLIDYAANHPAQTGAMVGGLAAAPFTGGASVLAAGLGSAGGAGIGEIVDQVRNGPKSALKIVNSMLTEGLQGAAGEGIGQGVTRLATKAGKLIYKTALRPSMSLQRDFGDIAATGLREGRLVSEGGGQKVVEQLKDLGEQTRGVLAAKDAVRPPVRGYLPPAQGVALGQAPIHPTVPNLRDPRSAGVLLRDALPDAAATTGEAAHGAMIAPAEIARRGLGSARAELSDRALSGDASDALGALEQRFLQQRNAPLTLTQAQRLKQAEQALSDAAYKAEQMGHPVNGVDAQFHKGVARGTREAIEARAPEVGPLNQKAQELIGLKLAIEDATRRNVPGVGSLRSLLGDFAPATASSVGIGLDRFGRSAMAPATFRSALIAALGGNQQQ